jgi:hypothetical protein
MQAVMVVGYNSNVAARYENFWAESVVIEMPLISKEEPLILKALLASSETLSAPCVYWMKKNAALAMFVLFLFFLLLFSKPCCKRGKKASELDHFGGLRWHTHIDCDGDDYPLFQSQGSSWNIQAKVCWENFTALALAIGAPVDNQVFALILQMLSGDTFECEVEGFCAAFP